MTREDAVLNLIANGEIRLAEAARMLGWTHQRISRRAARAGINAKSARRAYVQRAFAEAAAIGREIAATGKPMTEALGEVMERRG